VVTVGVVDEWNGGKEAKHDEVKQREMGGVLKEHRRSRMEAEGVGGERPSVAGGKVDDKTRES